jgi:2-dehydropantoate 2-reductase
MPRSRFHSGTLPEGLLVALLQRFLRSPTAAHSGLNSTSPAAAAAELERIAEQICAYAKVQ